MPNALYFGDNLQIMREHIPDASVDLVLRRCRKAGHQPRSIDVSRAALIQHQIAKLAAEPDLL